MMGSSRAPRRRPRETLDMSTTLGGHGSSRIRPASTSAPCARVSDRQAPRLPAAKRRSRAHPRGLGGGEHVDARRGTGARQAADESAPPRTPPAPRTSPTLIVPCSDTRRRRRWSYLAPSVLLSDLPALSIVLLLAGDPS